MTTTDYTPATDKQINTLFNLAVQMGWHKPEDKADFIKKIWAGIAEQDQQTSRRVVSDLISATIELVKKQRTGTDTARIVRPAATPDVPAGHYALVNSNDGKTYFFKVDRPTEGRWAGYTFVKRISGDNELRVDRAESRQILAGIARNPLEAAVRYGHEKGVCSVCHRGLTDETSRTLGIGPVCLKKYFGDGAEDAAWKIAFARREAEQERAAYMAEMNDGEF